MIGITFALPSESSDLIRRLEGGREDSDLLFGKIGAREVAIVHTGVGAKYCNQHLEALLHKARPRAVISSGFAGAVTNELPVGSLIVADNFSDPELLQLAEQRLANQRLRRVKLFTSVSIVDSISERNDVARQSGAAAVDMETGAIVAVCRAHATPLISMRAISDSPGEPLPAPPTALFDLERQRTNYGRLLAYILRHPVATGRLLRFGREIARLRATLADAIVALVQTL